jgi:hypothetical protein
VSSAAAPVASTALAASSAPAATPAPGGAVTDIAWDAPSGWQSVPSASAMRKASYRIPKAAGDAEDAEMSVTQVGGGLDANIDRWVTQFGGSRDSLKRTQRTVGPLKVTIVELEGKFSGGGMPGAPSTGPKEGWALLGAIVESVDPPYFFKLTGPKKTVQAARPAFDKLVSSMHAK